MGWPAGCKRSHTYVNVFLGKTTKQQSVDGNHKKRKSSRLIFAKCVFLTILRVTKRKQQLTTNDTHTHTHTPTDVRLSYAIIAKCKTRVFLETFIHSDDIFLVSTFSIRYGEIIRFSAVFSFPLNCSLPR